VTDFKASLRRIFGVETPKDEKGISAMLGKADATMSKMGNDLNKKIGKMKVRLTRAHARTCIPALSVLAHSCTALTTVSSSASATLLVGWMEGSCVNCILLVRANLPPSSVHIANIHCPRLGCIVAVLVSTVPLRRTVRVAQSQRQAVWSVFLSGCLESNN
jgi:hypothetical protein